MNTKTTKIVAAIALLGVAYTGASWWLGKRVEERYAGLMERAIAMVGKDVIVERHYERGIFSSKSTMVLQLDWPKDPVKSKGADDQDDEDDADGSDPSAAMQRMRITLQDDIRHGPIPGFHVGAALIQTRLVKVDGVDDATRQMFAKVSPPVFDTVAGFGGTYSGQARLPAGELTDPESPRSTFQWQELAYDYRYDTETHLMSGSARWPQLTMRVGPEAAAQSSADGVDTVIVRMDGLKADFDVSQLNKRWYFLPGQQSGTIDALSVNYMAAGQSASKKVLGFKGLKFDSKMTSKDGLMDSVGHLTGAGHIGELELKEVSAESALHRVSEEALEAFQKVMDQMKASDAQGKPGEVAPEAIEALVDALLKPKPEYRFSMKATSADNQTAQLGYGVTIDDAHNAPANEPWARRVQQRLHADANVRVPKGWLPKLAGLGNGPKSKPETLAALAGTLVREGILVEEGDAYVAKATYGDNQLSLNGKPLFGGKSR